MGGKRKRNVVLVADGVTVEKPILSKEEELQWEKRATHHAELLKNQQAGEEMKLRIRQEKKRLREAEAEHRRRLIRSTKVAQIMTRIADIKQLRREIVDKEALVTRDPIWDDKLDCFRKRRKFRGMGRDAATAASDIPIFAGVCGACVCEAALAEIQLWHDRDGVLVWMCHQCREQDIGRVAERQEIWDMRCRVTPLLESLKELTSGSGMVSEQVGRLSEIWEVFETRSDRSGDTEDDQVSKRKGRSEIWDVMTGSLPEVDQLEAGVSLTGLLPDLLDKLNRLRYHYTKVFQCYYLDGLIEKSVESRNADIRARYKDRPPPLLTLKLAKQRWIDQEGCCALCKEGMFWWVLMYGKHSTPQIDRIDIEVGTYVDNFQWLCRSCNTAKGFETEMRRYDELLVATLENSIEAFGRGDVGYVQSILRAEIDRQCSRQKYVQYCRQSCDRTLPGIGEEQQLA
jgi:hypothetical protein